MTRLDKIQHCCQVGLKALNLKKVPVRLERGKDLITIGWPEKTGIAIVIQPTPASNLWFFLAIAKIDGTQIKLQKIEDNVYDWRDVSVEAVALLARILIQQAIEGVKDE